MRPESSRAAPVAPPEPQLSERELKIVRGIIDSYEYRRWERRFWGGIGDDQ